MKERLNKLCSLLDLPELDEGINGTAIPYIQIHKCSGNEIILPDVRNSFIYYIVSGNMRIHEEAGIASFFRGDFFVSAAYRPLFATTDVETGNAPFLALVTCFDTDDIISVLLDIDAVPGQNDEAGRKLQENYSKKFCDIFIRLFESPENRFMLKHLKRELVFEIINSPNSKKFVENALRLQCPSEIFTVNSWIKQNYRYEFAVEDLANQANMSISSFHQKFKAAVGMGPIQCQKKLRLTEARRLMLDKSANVTEAAFEVGYESLSQFVSDYRRMFGLSPQKDIQEIRDRLITRTQSQ